MKIDIGKALSEYEDEKILNETLLMMGDTNRTYDEIGNKNVYGLSSTQTTLPRNEYWRQVSN